MKLVLLLLLLLYSCSIFAQLLCRMCLEEPGENCQDGTYAHRINKDTGEKECVPGWQMPGTWEEDGGVPDRGLFQMRYKTFTKNQPFRDEIMACFLIGSMS